VEVGWDGHFPIGETLTDQLVVPEQLPSWRTADDLALYVDELTRSGFRGGLNYYRNIDALPAILAPFVGATIDQPALYVAASGRTERADTPAAVVRCRGPPSLASGGRRVT
jgi:hypothetical protein